MTVPLAFEPKADGTMQVPPRNPKEPLITRSLLHRIVLVSLFNWVLIFGIFEWAKSTPGNLAIARTMAIQSLVAARIIYLLSISQLGASALNYLRGKTKEISQAPILVVGIIVAVILQIAFSQLPLMNLLFETAPLSVQQWLLCCVPMLPMVLWALLTNYIDPFSKNTGGG